ncbi:hypothetical protein MKW98_014027 [Papaver atlanticum]|uniref:Uncharacterized protein n=1 Tax=Papaver atlanticum TaxID=357466 RepID=A0AAD4XG04_9MAGN|nr:hypothetical protein MKW98_014027 [Papaver atlanticum]
MKHRWNNESYVDWSIDGIMKHVKSEKFMEKIICKAEKYFLELKSRGTSAFQRKEYSRAVYWTRHIFFWTQRSHFPTPENWTRTPWIHVQTLELGLHYSAREIRDPLICNLWTLVDGDTKEIILDWTRRTVVYNSFIVFTKR